MDNRAGPLIDQVSVIIPVHNRPALLKRAILSVRNQTLAPLEIIVVDDGSDEHSFADTIASFPEVHFYKQENHGVSHARNSGIKKAKGEWIAFLDSDDIWDPFKLQKQNMSLIEHPNALLLHTDEKWIRKNKLVNPPTYMDKSNNKLFSRSLKRCIIGCSTVVIKRSVFDTVGFFDETLKVCEDYDLWLRFLIEHGPLHVPLPLVTKFGGHSDQLSSKYWGMDRFRVQSLENLLSHKKIKNWQRMEILNSLINKLEILSLSFLKHDKLKQSEEFRKKQEKYKNLLDGISDRIKTYS